jgi:hypothetical protein
MFENEPIFLPLTCSLATALTKENALIVCGREETIVIGKPEVGDWLGYLHAGGRIVLKFIL